MLAPTESEELEPGVWPVVWTTLVGGLSVLFGTTIVAVALEPLARILDAPLSTIQWISTGYLLALAVAIPVVPWAQRRFGGRRLWMFGLTLFLIASVLCASAGDATLLIVFRAVQGLGGGILMPLMSTLVMQAAAGKGLTRIVAVVSMPAVLGPILGPVLGGLVLERLDWRWLFLINVPLVVAGLVLSLLYLPRDGPTVRARFDVAGFFLMSAALVGVLYGLGNASKHGDFAHVDVVAPLTIGVVLVAVFVWWARRGASDALIDVRLLTHRPLASSTALLFLSSFVLYGAMLLLPLYFQQLRGMSALAAGLLLIPQGAGTLLSRALVARLTTAFGSRVVVVAGFAIVAIGTAPFLFGGTKTSLTLLSVFLFIRGVGLGAVTVPLMALAFDGLKHAEVPHASVISRIGLQLGGSFGTAILTVILQAAISSTGAEDDGFRIAFWCATALALAAIFLSVLLPPHRPRAHRAPQAD